MMPKLFGALPRQETITGSGWLIDKRGPLWGLRQLGATEDEIRQAIDNMSCHPRKDPMGVKYRAILEMRFYGRWTHQQIAEKMGWKDRRWAGVYMRRALNRLQTELGPRTPDRPQ